MIRHVSYVCCAGVRSRLDPEVSIRRCLLALATCAALLAAPTAALAHTATLSATTTSNGQNHTFTFNNLPTGTGNVTLTVGLQGDFSYGNLSNPEGSENYADGNLLGTFIPANDGYSSGDCTGDVYTKNFTFPTSYINDNNQVVIRVDLYPEVNTFCTGQQDISATISYTSNTAPVLSSIANQTTPEDTADSVGFSVSDAEDSNGSISVSASSSNTSVIPSVTASNSGGSGTLSWTPASNVSGTSTITVTATDSGGATATSTFTITVTAVNDAPVANAGGPYTGNEGSSISLDGSASTDIDSSIVGWEWDCDGDGTADSIVASATGGSCTFDNNGNYTIGLQVQDASGAYSTTDTATVSVHNVSPTASLTGPSSGTEGSQLSYTASATDPSSADSASLTYAWGVVDSNNNTVANGTGTAPAFTPPDNGTYTVNVVVSDPDGGTDTASITVTVTNVAPTVSISGSASGAEGSASSWTLVGADASSTDATGLSYTWDITDASNNTVASGTGSSPSWTPADDGSYTLSAVVIDPQNATGTNSLSLSISNVAPTLSISGSATGDEGSSNSYALLGADAGSVDANNLSYAWTITDSSNATVASGNGDGLAWTPDDDGSYTLSATVTDPQGATGSSSLGLTISNVAPVVNSINGPATGDEGQSLSFSAGVTDAGSADVASLVTTWGWGDASSTDTGTSQTHTFADDGTYTVTVTVTDSSGATDSDFITVTISNVAPTLSITGAATGNEGSAGSWTLVGADAGSVDAAALAYTWEITDASSATVASGTGDTVSWTPDNDGAYTLSAIVTDPQGATGTASLSLTIDNVAPEVLTMTGPATGDEGSSLSFAATVDDAGSADVAGLVTTWDWGDSSAIDTGLTPSHTFADDGTFTVTVTVTDAGGASDSETLTVTVANVDPVIDSQPPLDAPEAVLYSYQPTVTDPGDEVFLWTLSASAPAAMTIDGATGLIEWTPTYADALISNFSIVLTVDDGDGGTDAQSWVIRVTEADDDADGMADGWELANGLDPTDPNDASADPDADGMTNLDEFGNGTDPNTYDGPSVPVLVEPIAGAEAFEVSPDLVFDNATDPGGDVLTYNVEVYSDAALTALVTSAAAVAEDASGQTTWKVDVVLTENAEYYWRAQASDAWVDGAWTLAESFVVNAANEAPDAPVLTFPIGGETAASASPVLVWSEAVDIDGDTLTYDVEVYDSLDVLVTTKTGLAGDGASAEWEVDVALNEDAFYSWTARAVDEHGLAGDWAVAEDFFVSSENAAPSDTVFIAPDDGSSIVAVSPTLECTESIDPEGGAVDYWFELDTVTGFDSADYLDTTNETPIWDLSDDNLELTENTWFYARVRAIDEAGISSVPDTISFFVRGDNDAPTVPVLSEPADAAEGSATPTLVVEDPTDPEDDAILLDFMVTRDAEMTEVLAEVSGVLVAGEGTTSWLVDVNLEGTVYWTARAVDLDGAASDWATPWSYVAPSESVPPTGDDDDDDDDAGCDCQNSVGGVGATGLWAFALLLPLGLLRRRR